MPFAENPSRVASLLQCLWKGIGIERHAFPLVDRMGNPIFKRHTATHQRCPSRRAGRAHLEIGEADGFIMKLIDMGRLHDFIPHTGEIAHALIIGYHQDNIGTGSLERFTMRTAAK